MSDHDPIDAELIDAWRSERAPAGFAAAVVRASADRRPRSRPLLRWAVPAAAMAILMIVISTGTFAPKRDSRDFVALSFAGMPAGLPTLSRVDTLQLTSVAALGVLPNTRTMNLNLPAVGRVPAAGRAPDASKSTK